MIRDQKKVLNDLGLPCELLNVICVQQCQILRHDGQIINIELIGENHRSRFDAYERNAPKWEAGKSNSYHRSPREIAQYINDVVNYYVLTPSWAVPEIRRLPNNHLVILKIMKGIANGKCLDFFFEDQQTTTHFIPFKSRISEITVVSSIFSYLPRYL